MPLQRRLRLLLGLTIDVAVGVCAGRGGRRILGIHACWEPLVAASPKKSMKQVK
jgi:hypothetical protein